MSANNWSPCPVCKKIIANKAVRLRRIADDSYGKCSREHFEKLQEQAIKAEEAIDEIDSHLREDYLQGLTDDGTEYQVRYKASCYQCAFTYSYTNQVNITGIVNDALKRRSEEDDED